MNLYDKICVRCIKCNKFIGEVDCDAKIIMVECGMCTS